MTRVLRWRRHGGGRVFARPRDQVGKVAGNQSRSAVRRGRVSPVWRSVVWAASFQRVFDKLRKAVMGQALPTEPVVVRAPHAGFGTFTLTGEWDPRVVTVTGPWSATIVLSAPLALPEALKRRLVWLVRPPRIVPNDRHAITLTVDGQPAPLDCGRRAMRRATFNVRATVVGREYLLRHERLWRARLERNGQVVSRLSTVDKGQTLRADYQPGADVVDATVGLALGMTLGVGAPGFLRNLVDVL